MQTSSHHLARPSTKSSPAARSQNRERSRTSELVKGGKSLDPTKQPSFEEQEQELAPKNETTPEPSPAPAPEDVKSGNAELDALMANERLSATDIAKARALIKTLPAAEQRAQYEALQSKSAYMSQRNVLSRGRANKSETLASRDNLCNLTSLAMCFEQLGIPNPGTLDGKPYPHYADYLEALRIKHALGERTIGQTFVNIGKKMTPKVTVAELGIAGKIKRDIWKQKVGSVLGSGSAVFMSITDHIVRVQSVTEDGLIIDDPNGLVKLNTPTIRKGKQKHTWSYGATANEKDAPESEAGGSKGEDNLWTWAEVEKHSMLWVRGCKIG